MKTRYVITHINRDGMRALSLPNQGQHHFDEKEAADAWLKSFNQNNSESTLVQLFGRQALGTFEVRPCQCYDHGDAVGIYFDSESFIAQKLADHRAGRKS